MFNVRDEKAAARYQRYLIRLMAIFENRQAKRWQPTLSKAYKAAARLIEHGNQDFQKVLQDHRKDVSSLLASDYRNLLAYFGTFAFDQFEKEYKKSINSPNKKSMEDVYWEEVSKWARLEAAKKVVNIIKTTEKLIAAHIKQGMNQGLSNQEIAKMILEEKDPLINKMRAMRIVRTETHTAANKAIQSAVKSTGFKHDKIWRSTLDDRIRGLSPKDRFNHLKANRQKRDLEEYFDISGEKLMFPGDTKFASAGNVINCRCVSTYDTKSMR